MAKITSQFEGSYSNLSIHKYSSNVIERSIEKDPKCLSRFIEEVLATDQLCDLMKNNYGNYVVQKAVKVSVGPNKILFVQNVLKNLSKLNNNKLVKKWKAIIRPYLPASTLKERFDYVFAQKFESLFDDQLNIYEC